VVFVQKLTVIRVHDEIVDLIANLRGQTDEWRVDLVL
jgi:hypothetical protein